MYKDVDEGEKDIDREKDHGTPPRNSKLGKRHDDDTGEESQQLGRKARYQTRVEAHDVWIWIILRIHKGDRGSQSNQDVFLVSKQKGEARQEQDDEESGKSCGSN